MYASHRVYKLQLPSLAELVYPSLDSPSMLTTSSHYDGGVLSQYLCGYHFLGGAVTFTERGFEELPPRQAQVVLLGAMGLRETVIATLLNISAGTVNRHSGAAYKKIYENGPNRMRYGVLYAMVSAQEPFARITRPASDRRLYSLDEDSIELLKMVVTGMPYRMISKEIGDIDEDEANTRFRAMRVGQRVGMRSRGLLSAGGIVSGIPDLKAPDNDR
jgi:hypothetical protein